MAQVKPIKTSMRGKSRAPKPGAGIDYVPTNADRRRVWIMAAIQVPIETIAACIGDRPDGISVPTLYKYYGPLLKTAAQSANAKVARALYNKCLGGDTTAMIFWLKTRAGFKESAGLELTGKVEVVKRVIGVDESEV